MSKLIWIILKTKNSLTSTSAIWRRRQWNPTPVLLPGKSHGWRSLEGCSPWDRWGSDTTEQLHFHFSLSCIGEGNGNPLQCSCLENPRDGEPGGLPSMGSHRVGHDWTDLAATAAAEFLEQLKEAGQTQREARDRPGHPFGEQWMLQAWNSNLSESVPHGGTRCLRHRMLFW